MEFKIKFAENSSSFNPEFGETQVVQGQNGATFIPDVSQEGVISWTNDRGLPNPAPVNIKGKDGYTPVKGVDYFDGIDGEDGYTPQKGVDYFDGTNGKDGLTPYIQGDYWYIGGQSLGVNAKGRDGTSITIINSHISNESGGISTITFSNGTEVSIRNGTNGRDGTDGEDGKDGISATHRWDGTVLTVTSASGTSSVDLKGEKGDKGDGFKIEKTYTSVVAMNAGFYTDGVPLNGFVLINTGNVNDEDNAKLFVKGAAQYTYLTDLSGAQGIKGEDGKNGNDGKGISSIIKTATSGLVDTYTITYTDNSTTTFSVTNGAKGADGTSVTVSSVDETTVSGGRNIVNFSDGTSVVIKNGKDGANGSNYTLTDADRDQIANLVITKLGGEPIFGYIDENNNIIVQGNLEDGTYSVKYEMENGSKVNIGNLVLDSNVYYSVTKNLTNCTINNSATEAIGGKSYSATITANSGYELKYVSVTMGGANVSVTNGVINISNVTGNIVITAVAEVNKPAYTNLFVPSEAQINKRVSNSLELKDIAGHFATAFIDVSGKTPFTDATKIYIKGANFNASSSGTNQTKILTYASKPASGYSGNYSVIQGNNISPTNEGNGVISVSNIASSFAGSVKYMVLTLKVSDSTLTTADIQNIVITIDEPIN